VVVLKITTIFTLKQSMAKSKETFNKREKEKKRLKQKQEKREKMEERKANAGRGKSLDEMMAYIDEHGNITSTPPDPRMKKVFSADEIEIGVPRRTDEADDAINEGTVSYFNESKGFGFILDSAGGERLFFHVNQLQERISENDKVTYDIEKGAKGLNAVNIKKL
jgi:cold shock CspA family protein